MTASVRLTLPRSTLLTPSRITMAAPQQQKAQALRTGLRHYTPGSVTINAERLNDTLHDTCQRWGTGQRWGNEERQTGMSRLTLTDADSEVRTWLREQAESLGCTTHVDEVGNMFMIRPATASDATSGDSSSSLPPTAMGSHMDTQPTGGRYDGILGVMAGLEVLRTLNERNIQTRHPVALINWTNEEGARFPYSMMGSSVWSGDLPLERAYALKDQLDGKTTVKGELERTGWLGEMRASHEAMPLGGYFELHIEQGPILERESKTVGVVMGGQAFRWHRLTVRGQEKHTGSTPMEARADALVTAAKIIVESNRLAKEMGCLISTGTLDLTPQSVNTCPGMVRFTIDIRHQDVKVVDEAWQRLHARAKEIAANESDLGTTLDEVEIITDSAAPAFHEDCTSAIREAAVALVGEGQVREMYSGAGHDAHAASKHCPTAMIFVPSKDGISHNPVEYTSPEECATGAQVLLDSVLLYDSRRGE